MEVEVRYCQNRHIFPNVSKSEVAPQSPWCLNPNSPFLVLVFPANDKLLNGLELLKNSLMVAKLGLVWKIVTLYNDRRQERKRKERELQSEFFTPIARLHKNELTNLMWPYRFHNQFIASLFLFLNSIQ